ncbi:ubiquinol-cytochrome c reductase cytochrome c1 subunit [Methylomarinovum caldicuralii]|uniref:Ubiquinol-cytochrome c reductase cytochrome c1 subunit n=1 Tax=Methylomarinovum caldicuralii TaxID=438856 RepID=A0AAU9CAE1_9GAMM|nr:cytochrome c1 [Methylomarinovum caldicuralii]BCX81469.1 ubiquinol-cytochrome c reductase cytochrome c1 subunit [Methylomarinovum caldicuralii]
MRKLILAFLLLCPVWAAAELGAPLQQPDIDVFDKQSLRRGLKTYVDRCLGCHSLKHLRYRRLQQDLELSDEEMQALFPHLERIIGTMTTAMDPKDAKAWFGVATPDLSERVRALGTDWLYTYLRTFYKDDKRPFGVNNWVFKDVAMPHVLWDLQGEQEAVIVEINGNPVIQKLEPVKPGEISPREFDRLVADLVNFMAYAAEPAQLKRVKIGKYVILFLLVLAFVSWRLKKAYWKDVH